MPKTTVEKIDSIKTQIQQLDNERKRLLNLQKEADRKARTKRLIERGAILESLISNADKYTNEQIKFFLERIVQSETARKILGELTSTVSEIAIEKTAVTEHGGG